jgi:hypothetical protein
LDNFSSSNKKKIIVLTALMLVALVCAALFMGPINQQRKDYGLTYTKDPTKNTPPSVAFMTTALGAFRNIIIDVLWVRAMNVMENGNYFEAAQLYSMIGEMQPHFADIWIHNAWNMAYNISVNFPQDAPGDWTTRWTWVQKGIRLLRDKAMPLNTRSVNICDYLGTIYWHKVGGFMDDAHVFYKEQFAQQMKNVLGDYIKDIGTVADAYENAGEILAREDVANLILELEENELDLFKLDLEKISTLPDTITRIMQQPQYDGASEQLMLVVRGQYLKKTLKLDPVIMKEMEANFNWFDWRLPEVHGLYWFNKATGLAKESKTESERFYDQKTQQALKLMFDRGRIVDMPDGGIAFMHDLTKTDYIHRHFLDRIEKYDEKGTFRDAHRNWLQEATMMHFTYGEIEKARELYYTIIRKYKPQLAETLFEEWVMARVQVEMESAGTKQAEAFVMGQLRLIVMYADMGEMETANTLAEYARAFYEDYQSKKTERQDLPSWDQLEKVARRNYLAEKQIMGRVEGPSKKEVPVE